MTYVVHTVTMRDIEKGVVLECVEICADDRFPNWRNCDVMSFLLVCWFADLEDFYGSDDFERCAIVTNGATLFG